MKRMSSSTMGRCDGHCWPSLVVTSWVRCITSHAQTCMLSTQSDADARKPLAAKLEVGRHCDESLAEDPSAEDPFAEDPFAEDGPFADVPFFAEALAEMAIAAAA